MDYENARGLRFRESADAMLNAGLDILFQWQDDGLFNGTEVRKKTGRMANWVTADLDTINRRDKRATCQKLWENHSTFFQAEQ